MIDTSGSSIPTADDECAFCGGRSGLTRQHAVPYWFMHEVHADPRMIHSYLLTDITGLLKGSFNFPNVIEKGHGNLTVFWTCEKCIGGWIHDLELEVIEPFTRLVRMPVSTKAEISSAVDFLASVSDSLEIIAWDIIAMAYHNERTNRKFYGILD